jgi:hypothetical protein
MCGPEVEDCAVLVQKIQRARLVGSSTGGFAGAGLLVKQGMFLWRDLVLVAPGGRLRLLRLLLGDRRVDVRRGDSGGRRLVAYSSASASLVALVPKFQL